MPCSVSDGEREAINQRYNEIREIQERYKVDSTAASYLRDALVTIKDLSETRNSLTKIACELGRLADMNNLLTSSLTEETRKFIRDHKILDKSRGYPWPNEVSYL